MSHRRLTPLAVVMLGLAGFATTGPAVAEPPPPPCAFSLSPPQLVQVSGTDMVTATLAPAECKTPATPMLSVACLQLQGSATAPRCAQVGGPGTARVYAPYRAGSTYVSTGRGCATTVRPPASICQTTGPTAVTL